MPLLEVSHNIHEPDSVGRKRSHAEYSSDEALKVESAADTKNVDPATIPENENTLLHPMLHSQNQPSTRGSPALTETGSSTPARNSSCPPTPPKDMLEKTSAVDNQNTDSSAKNTQPAGMANPPAKRKRLTQAEKDARDKELAEKKAEREKQLLAKAAEKAKQEEEKAARAKEREEKAAEKAKEKEEKKKQKEEEQRRIQEEKDKKARSQKTLGNFFKLPSTPKKVEDKVTNSGSPDHANSTMIASKNSSSEYAKLFKPFFVKGNTTVAPMTVVMDDETRARKCETLDNGIASQQHSLPFDPVDHFSMPKKAPARGRLHQPVKHIMETAYRETQDSTKLGSGDSNDIFAKVRGHLSKVPMKVIAFSQDVRPPYYGTVTFKSFALGKGNMLRLARRSMGRRLPLDYDYDSEAEWQDEEGEDLDMEDEEEELDDEDDMDGFLDDSEDAGISRRVFGKTLEPECSGICFEDANRRGPNPAVYDHKMEFICDGLPNQWGIDPFSTRYWEPEPKTTKSKASKAVKPDGETKMLPPPAPANAFAALAANGVSNTAPGKLVKTELMNDIKQAILDNKALSKVGIIDFIFHQFRDSVSRAEVKNTIEFVAEKKGAGRSKEWELKPGHEIAL